MTLFMYILGYYLNLTTPSLNPIMIAFSNASIVLLLAGNTPASHLDEKVRRQVWRYLWVSRYMHYRYNNPSHLCSRKSADFAKIIAAAQKLGVEGKVKRDGVYFNDGSKIDIWHPIFKDWDKR